MPLPVLQPEIYAGLRASKFDEEALLDRIANENPEVLRIMKVMQEGGNQSGYIGALVLYRLLQAQADCEDL